MRLASELTGWKIDLYSSREWLERGGEGGLFSPLPLKQDEEDAAAANVSLAELEGITAELLAVLTAAGKTTLADVIDLEADEIKAIEGMTEDMAGKLVALIDELTTGDEGDQAAGAA